MTFTQNQTIPIGGHAIMYLQIVASDIEVTIQVNKLLWDACVPCSLYLYRSFEGFIYTIVNKIYKSPDVTFTSLAIYTTTINVYTTQMSDFKPENVKVYIQKHTILLQMCLFIGTSAFSLKIFIVHQVVT